VREITLWPGIQKPLHMSAWWSEANCMGMIFSHALRKACWSAFSMKMSAAAASRTDLPQEWPRSRRQPQIRTIATSSPGRVVGRLTKFRARESQECPIRTSTRSTCAPSAALTLRTRAAGLPSPKGERLFEGARGERARVRPCSTDFLRNVLAVILSTIA